MHNLEKLLKDNFPKSKVCNVYRLPGMEEHYIVDDILSVIKWDRSHYNGAYEYAKHPCNYTFFVARHDEKTLIRRLKEILKGE